MLQGGGGDIFTPFIIHTFITSLTHKGRAQRGQHSQGCPGGLEERPVRLSCCVMYIGSVLKEDVDRLREGKLRV